MGMLALIVSEEKRLGIVIDSDVSMWILTLRVKKKRD